MSSDYGWFAIERKVLCDRLPREILRLKRLAKNMQSCEVALDKIFRYTRLIIDWISFIIKSWKMRIQEPTVFDSLCEDELKATYCYKSMWAYGTKCWLAYRELLKVSRLCSQHPVIHPPKTLWSLEYRKSMERPILRSTLAKCEKYTIIRLNRVKFRFKVVLRMSLRILNALESEKLDILTETLDMYLLRMTCWHRWECILND